MTYREELVAAGACQDAIDWVGERDAVTAWRECERADWLLWEAERRKVPEHLLIRAACACARTALQYVPAGEDRPRLAIEAAEAVADALEAGVTGKAFQSLRARAARAASDASAASAASDARAAWAASAAFAASDARAAWAASAASAASDARAAWAAWAASAAFAASAASAASSASDAAHRNMCQLVRQIIPEPKGGEV